MGVLVECMCFIVSLLLDGSIHGVDFTVRRWWHQEGLVTILDPVQVMRSLEVFQQS